MAERIPAAQARGDTPKCLSCGARQGRPGQPDRPRCFRCRPEFTEACDMIIELHGLGVVDDG